MQSVLEVANKTIQINGRFLKLAKLRHEWFEFIRDPLKTIAAIQSARTADVFTFVDDFCDRPPAYRFMKETASISVLRVTTFQEWWDALDFKVRNKIRKAEKTGVEFRSVSLDEEFARGVEQIYNESPIRQGMPFWHYGKSAEVIKEDLSSFPECTFFVGAYFKDELIGFMKLFESENALRTVHIIAKLSHRDKPVQDALIAKAVQLCEAKGIHNLHYGDWSVGGLGAFKIKHGFERVDVARYFVPLNFRGELMLRLNLQRPLTDRFPPNMRQRLVALRSWWNGRRYGSMARRTVA